MNNKRHYKRYPVKCTGYFVDSKAQNFRFQVNDISASGMNITINQEINDTHPLTFNFDIAGTHLPHSNKLKGVVVRKKNNKADFSYSIRFLELTHDEIIELDEYLRYTQKNHTMIHT